MRIVQIVRTAKARAGEEKDMAILLAITELSQWLMFAAAAVGLSLILVARLVAKRGTLYTTRPAIAFDAILLALALALWLRPILYLGAWGLWIGDNQHWFYDASPYLATLIAVTYSIWFSWRITQKRTTVSYVRIHRWGSVVLLVMFGAALVSEFVQPILASDPHVAVERCIQQWPAPTTLRLKALPKDPNSRPDLDYRSFLILGESEPRGRVDVYRYGHFWWALAGSRQYRPSKEELQRAKERMQTDPEIARMILTEIIAHCPDPAAATEARQILKDTEPSADLPNAN
jgi:hypothetical protein